MLSTDQTRSRVSTIFPKTVLAGAILIATSGMAFAQSEGGAGRSAASKLMEEVMVTATKKSQAESLQEVPIAVSAFNGDQLDAMFAQDIRDVGSSVPNVMFSEVRTVPGTASFFVRGTGSGQSIQSYQPGVGVVQDGIPLGVLAGSIVDTFDLESVEVLRGPQGTLFGRNVSGGAVVTRTQRPSGEFNARVKASIGSESLRQFNVMAEAPLGDSVSGLISINSKDADGYLKNTNTAVGDDIGGTDLMTTRGVLTFNPSEQLEVTAIASLYKSNGGGTPAAAAILPADRAYVGPSQRPDFWATGHNVDGYTDQEIKSFVLEANYMVEGGVVTAIAGRRTMKMDSSSDLDGSANDFFNVYLEVDHEQTSFELRYASDEADWGSYTAGLFYYDASLENGEFRSILGNLSGPRAQAAFGEEDNTAFALFAQGDVKLSENLNLILGLRWNSEEKDAGATPLASCPIVTQDTLAGTGAASVAACGSSLTDSESWKNWSPKVGIQWFADEDTQWYATYTSGFRSGSYNVRTPGGTTDLRPADEETTDAFEIGLKQSFMDGKVRFNAAAFLNNIDDFQEIAQSTTPNGIIQTLVNAGEARTKGIELEVSALLSERLVLNASLGLLDAEYTDLDIAPGAEDWDFVKTPEKTANVALTYDLDVSDVGVASIRGSYSFRDEMAAGFDNAANPNVIESYGELNASIVLNTFDDKWTVSLSGKNLLDDENTDSRFYIGSYLVEYLSPGRTWSASVEYRF
ncbi:MAG: hypothetical protein RI942_1683 [Pseudomonadota bacterium]|jgi:iron complex outermembrane receptor protein